MMKRIETWLRTPPTLRARVIAMFVFTLWIAFYYPDVAWTLAAVALLGLDVFSAVIIRHQHKLIAKQQEGLRELLKLNAECIESWMLAEHNLRRAIEQLGRQGFLFERDQALTPSDKESMT